MFFLKEKIQEAIDFLKAHEPDEGYNVKFSGGKDSIVMYDIVKKSGVRHTAHYNFTTIDPPQLTRFILKHYPEIIWLRPKKNFFQYLLSKGLPTKQKRWCCEKLKHKIHAKGSSPHKVVGIRAEESKRRSERGRISVFAKGRGEIMYSPIFYFTEADVWDCVATNGLAYPSLYDEGFSRLGCVICPFICRSGGVLEKHRQRWPKLYEVFERTAAQYYEKKKEFFLQRGLMSAEELLALWYQSKPIPLPEDRKEKIQGVLF